MKMMMIDDDDLSRPTIAALAGREKTIRTVNILNILGKNRILYMIWTDTKS